MNASTPSQQYGPILNSLCSWGKAAEVLDLIKEWVAEGMNNFTHSIPQQPPVSLMVIKDLYRVIFMFKKYTNTSNCVLSINVVVFCTGLTLM